MMENAIRIFARFGIQWGEIPGGWVADGVGCFPLFR